MDRPVDYPSSCPANYRPDVGSAHTQEEYWEVSAKPNREKLHGLQSNNPKVG